MIAALSADRHHVVTLAELEAIGLSPRAVRHRAAAGRLHRLQRGVYSVGPPGERARAMAAVLACGEGALISHRSAAWLWGLRAQGGGAIDVTVRGSTGRRRPGVAIHSGAGLGDADAALVDGIPCTSLARTLLDLATVVDGHALERAVDRAEELQAFDLAAVEAILDRCRGRTGSARLRAVLEAWRGPAHTRSEAEERLLASIDAAGLPRPRVNEWIALEGGSGYRPDFLWRAARLIVEVDGRAHHARRAAFRHDRRRDRRLALAGYETRRYDAAEVLAAPARVAYEIAAFLRRRGPSGS